MKIGPMVREARAQRNWSQAHLAQLVGVNAPTISRIETGGMQPSVGTLLKLARELALDLNALLDGETCDPCA